MAEIIFAITEIGPGSPGPSASSGGSGQGGVTGDGGGGGGAPPSPPSDDTPSAEGGDDGSEMWQKVMGGVLRRMLRNAGLPGSLSKSIEDMLGKGVGDLGKIFGGGSGASATTSTVGEAEAAGLPTAEAAGGAGGALAGAGMAGAIVYAAMKIREEVEKLGDSLQSSIVNSSRFAASMMNGSGSMEMLVGLTNKWAQSMAEIDPVAGVIAKALAGTTEALFIFERALLDRAHNLAQFSASITAAEVFSEVRQMQFDIREAQAIGPQLASLIDSESRLSIAIQEAFLPLKEGVIPLIVNGMGNLANLANMSGKAVNAAVDANGNALQKLEQLFGPGGPLLAGVNGLGYIIGKNVTEAARQQALAEGKDLMDQLMKVPFGWKGFDPLKKTAIPLIRDQNPLHIPAFDRFRQNLPQMP